MLILINVVVNDLMLALFIIKPQGCADVVINGVKHNLGAIGGGAVVLGLFQVSVGKISR